MDLLTVKYYIVCDVSINYSLIAALHARVMDANLVTITLFQS